MSNDGTQTGDQVMSDIESNSVSRIESYAVDVNGVRKSDNLKFVDAVTLALRYKQQMPSSYIKVCDSKEPVERSIGENAVVAA